MPDQVTLIPLAAIEAEALPRDRTALDPEALAELQASILATGLRQPIEVFAAAPDPADLPGDAPGDGPRYGLISGYRRLAAFRALAAGSTDPRFAAIPAFVRRPADEAEALADMIAENEIRADLSPWEKGRIVVEARDQGLFPTLDEAVARLYPALNRQRRNRIRAVADVVEELGDTLAEPETLAQQHLLRLSATLRAGLGDLIQTALSQSSEATPKAQWRTILPIIEEAEEDAREATRPGTSNRPRRDYKPGRPRRVARIRPGLMIRRERTPEGWNLRFTGPDATGPLMEDVMDYVEQQFGRE
jgi:ParB family chromosome partitioning protein